MLQVLEQHKARSTFFMVGVSAQEHPEIVQRVAQAGHAVGNHSWDHPFLPSLLRHEPQKQIRACEQALAPYSQRLLRAPYGTETLASHLDALSLYYQVVGWSLGAEDWVEHDPTWMAEVLTKGIQPGSIVLLHDAIWDDRRPVPCNREPMLSALTLFLEKLSSRFRFVTIPELLRHGRPHYCNWDALASPGAKDPSR